MNRFVRLEDLLVRQGVLAIVLLLPCLLPSVVLVNSKEHRIRACRMLRHRKGLIVSAISPPA